MRSARQLLLMRLGRDTAIDIAIAPLGTVVLLPDPDLRRRVFRCVCHVEGHGCCSSGERNWYVGERGLSNGCGLSCCAAAAPPEYPEKLPPLHARSHKIAIGDSDLINVRFGHYADSRRTSREVREVPKAMAEIGRGTYAPVTATEF